MNIVAIIIAAGDATRWEDYRGDVKHFLKIEGELLIDRTIRLIKKNAPDAKIYVVGKTERYKRDGAELFIPTFNKENYGEDKFLNSKELWNKNGRTIVFYGDVWFSDEAMEKIIKYESPVWTMFGRSGPSPVTHCFWGECFAQSFYPADIEWHERMLLEAVRQVKEGLLVDAGGWEHYGLIQWGDPKNRAPGDRFYEINDFTEDFDFPHDYDLWIGSRKRWRKKNE